MKTTPGAFGRTPIPCIRHANVIGRWFRRLGLTRLPHTPSSPKGESGTRYRGEDMPRGLQRRRWMRATAVAARSTRRRSVWRAKRRVAKIEKQWGMA